MQYISNSSKIIKLFNLTENQLKLILFKNTLKTQHVLYSSLKHASDDNALCDNFLQINGP